MSKSPAVIDFKAEEQGIWLTFDRAFALNGHMPSAQWFLSWEKLSEIIARGKAAAAAKELKQA